jgi:hypothetical protein
MFEYILVAIVVIFIMKKLFGGDSGDNESGITKPTDKRDTKYSISEKTKIVSGDGGNEGGITELIDERDTKYNISEETKIISGEINKLGTVKVKVESTNKKPVSINLICFKDLSDLLKATDIVYSNAEMTGQNRMNESLFHYYCHLHYRSHLADQLCRQKCGEISAEFSNVNALIVRLNDKNDPLRVPKDQYDQIIRIKDLMKNIRNLLHERSNRLAIQTGIIRDKIGRECGERGYKWWLERKANAEIARNEKKRNQ